MRTAVALAIALAGCGRSERRATPEPPPVRNVPAVVTDTPIPAASRQLITVIVADWTATAAELQLWTRDSGSWVAAGPAWQGVIGKTGAAWGVGLHGRGAPGERSGPIKHEGDGKSPSGAFALAGSYGYAAKPPAGTALPYTQVDASWKCVDDPKSKHYNQILDQRATTPDWISAEEMRRGDPAYTWVVDIAHNAGRSPGDGSCIFLHVWSGADSATVGCTAMEEGKLAELIGKLDPAASPALVLLPRAEYDALAPAWALPR